MAVIKSSDPRAMREICKEIDRYADTLKNDLQKLSNKHRSVNGSWSGEQYDDFTQVLLAAKGKLEDAVQRLKDIAAEVQKDAEALETAQKATRKD